MKKFIFSAVALTAFSFSAMANNEVKEVEKIEVEETTMKTGVLDCDTFAISMVDMLDPDITWNDQQTQTALLQFDALCYLINNLP